MPKANRAKVAGGMRSYLNRGALVAGFHLAVAHKGLAAVPWVVGEPTKQTKGARAARGTQSVESGMGASGTLALVHLARAIAGRTTHSSTSDAGSATSVQLSQNGAARIHTAMLEEATSRGRRSSGSMPHGGDLPARGVDESVAKNNEIVVARPTREFGPRFADQQARIHGVRAMNVYSRQLQTESQPKQRVVTITSSPKLAPQSRLPGSRSSVDVKKDQDFLNRTQGANFDVGSAEHRLISRARDYGTEKHSDLPNFRPTRLLQQPLRADRAELAQMLKAVRRSPSGLEARDGTPTGGGSGWGPGSSADGQGAVTMEGDVLLDGALLGRWVARVLAQQAGRAPSGSPAFDPTRSPYPSGRMIGG